MNEVIEMGYKDSIGLLQAIRELNRALDDPKALDEALRIQAAMEKGAADTGTKKDATGQAAQSTR